MTLETSDFIVSELLLKSGYLTEYVYQMVRIKNPTGQNPPGRFDPEKIQLISIQPDTIPLDKIPLKIPPRCLY